MKRLEVKRLHLPAIAIIVSTLILMAILGVFSYQSYHREQATMKKHLLEEGTALIRAFEAGARTGMMEMMRMMGMAGQDDRIQTLVEETAKQPEVAYILIADEGGRITAHSQPDLIGKRLEDVERMPANAEVVSQIKELYSGERVFEVRKGFNPLKSPMEAMMRGLMGRRWRDGGHRMSGSSEAEGEIILLGLRMEGYEQARSRDLRRAAITALILVVLGSAAFYFLFVVQNYYLVGRTLRDMESYTRNVVESMPNGLISLDRAGQIVTINRNAAELLKLNEEDVKGTPLTEVMAKCDLDKTFLPNKDVFEKRVDCHLNDGSIVPISTTSSRLKNESGEVIGTVIILRDLREIRDLEEKVKRSERLASLGRMAAGIAHEIRNPLSSIKGFAQYFQRKFEGNAEDQKYAAVMVGEIDRLNRVIRNLLSFARPQEPHFESVDLHRVVEHALSLIASDAERQGIVLIKEYDAEVPALQADADLMTQVFLNLFLNAIEAMEDGGTLSVSTRRSSAGDLLNVVVADTGCGF
ncbi:TPA: PAS domain-containing protein, partial [Candidatus Poribacteria bacterium]|nr:PAS domain-containing protein [Candidatus Poribacteria bacterium]